MCSFPCSSCQGLCLADTSISPLGKRRSFIIRREDTLVVNQLSVTVEKLWDVQTASASDSQQTAVSHWRLLNGHSQELDIVCPVLEVTMSRDILAGHMRENTGLGGRGHPERTGETPEDPMAQPRTTHCTAGTAKLTYQTSDYIIPSTGQGSHVICKLHIYFWLKCFGDWVHFNSTLSIWWQPIFKHTIWCTSLPQNP